MIEIKVSWLLPKIVNSLDFQKKRIKLKEKRKRKNGGKMKENSKLCGEGGGGGWRG